MSKHINAQKIDTTNKVYIVHEPETTCITKGKAGKKYEFGQRVSVAVTSKGGRLSGALCIMGNPYDRHTLNKQAEQVVRLCIKRTGAQTVFVNTGYRDNDYQGERTVIVDKRWRGETPSRIWRWTKRRAALEPTSDTSRASTAWRAISSRQLDQCHPQNRRHELRQAPELLFGLSA